MGKEKQKYPKLYGVYAKIANSPYQKHTWAIPKGQAEKFASMLRSSRDAKTTPVSRISVKRLKPATIRKDIAAARGMSKYNLPPSMKKLLKRK